MNIFDLNGAQMADRGGESLFTWGQSTAGQSAISNQQSAPVYRINDLKLDYEFECSDIEYEKYSVIWNTIEGYMLEKLTMVMDVEIAEGTIWTP